MIFNTVKKVVSVLLFLSLLNTGRAQDIEQIPEEEAIDFSGSLSLRMTAYSSTRQNEFRDPFICTLSGNPTLSLYGITFPFSFTLSSKQADFRQPFNQFGMSPYYRWLTLHFGYRNVSFSNYTLNGHSILGAGFEADPGILRLGFMWGRLRKANELSVNTSGNYLAPYKRTGYAFKIGIGNNSNFLDLILFKARDDSTSVETPANDLDLQPAENLVLGLKGRQTFFNNILLDVDFGFSSYTRDLSSELLDTDEYRIPGFFTSIYDVRRSTNFNMAGSGSLSFKISSVRLKLKYLRIEPEYQSMGTYYTNSDRENITISPSFYLFSRKVRVNGSIGFQRNNLLKNKINQTQRQINSLNINYIPSAKVNFNVNYSNYQIDQKRILQPFDTTGRRDQIGRIIDSLSLQQYSQNINSNMNLNLGSKDHRHNINLNFNYQLFESETEAFDQDMGSENINPNIGYSYQNNAADYGARLNFNWNHFKTQKVGNTRIGVTAGFDKGFLEKKLNLNLSMTRFSNMQDNALASVTFSLRGRLNYQLASSHRLSLNVNYMSRNAKAESETSYKETLGTFGYSYSFR